MDLIVLRLIHILGGIFWVGSALTFFYFVQPTASATAPESQRFMLHLLGTRRLGDATLAAAIFNVGAGAILIWRDSNGLDATWLTGPGRRHSPLAPARPSSPCSCLASSGIRTPGGCWRSDAASPDEQRPPSEAEQAVLADSQRVLARLAVWVPILLIVAATSMATARYWPLLLSDPRRDAEGSSPAHGQQRLDSCEPADGCSACLLDRVMGIRGRPERPARRCS